MVPILLFVLGLITEAVIFILSILAPRVDGKNQIIAMPFALFLAAAVAKYIGF